MKIVRMIREGEKGEKKRGACVCACILKIVIYILCTCRIYVYNLKYYPDSIKCGVCAICFNDLN